MKNLKKRVAAWLGLFFVATQILPSNIVKANDETTDNIKYGAIEHYNGILFGGNNKQYTFTANGGDMEGAMAVNGNMQTPGTYSMGGAVVGYYEDKGMPTVMVSETWSGGKPQIYGDRVVVNNLQCEPESHTINPIIITKESKINISKRIDGFRNVIESNISYFKSIKDNGVVSTEYGTTKLEFNNETPAESNIFKGSINGDKVKINSFDLIGTTSDNNFYVIYSDAKNITFENGAFLYKGEIINCNTPYDPNALFTKLTQRVLWVFPNAETININSYGIIGSVLAPNAHVVGNGGSINGQLFASSLSATGGFELHNFTSKWKWQDGKGKIQVIKKDDLGNVLPGAKFNVINSKNEKVDEFTTNSNGIGLSKELPLGNYKLVEVEAPSGYVLNSTPIDVTISQNEEVVIKQMINSSIKGRVKIIKADLDNEDIKLEGAVFSIKDENGIEVGRITTGKDGIGIYENLNYGAYTISEIVAPDGYYLENFSKNITISENGQLVELQVSNSKAEGQVTLTKRDNKTNQPLKGVEFEVYNSEGIFIEKLITDINGKAISSKLPFGEYLIKETKALEGYVSANIEEEFEINENNKLISYEFRNDPVYGKIAINKVDSEDNSIMLSNAIFEIRDASGNLVDTVTTINGTAFSKELPYGTYTIKETSPPKGYILDGSDFEVSILSNNVTVPVTRENKLIHGKVEIKKIDKDNKSKVLEGAEFEVCNSNNIVVDKITTLSNGIGTSKDLPYGNYTIKEVKAPEGYINNEYTASVEISENNKILKYEVENSKEILGSISINKVDSISKEPLAGAIFQLTKLDGELVDELTTGDNGIVQFNNLRIGTYVIKEKQAPNGYILSGYSKEINITEDKPAERVEVENQRLEVEEVVGNISIKKVDSKTNNVLEGVEFTVYSGNEVVDTIVTGSSGVAVSKDLPFGSYTVKETKALEGYVLSDETYTVEINNSNSKINLEVKNEIIKGKIQVIKSDDTGTKRLEGAKFEVRNFNNELVETIVTNSNGIAESSMLPYGTYGIIEIEAPEGYELNSITNFVSILSNDVTVEVLVKNNPIMGRIQVTKKDMSDSSLLLEGAKFNVLNLNGEIVSEIVTGEGGVGYSEYLQYGDYTVVEVVAPNNYILDSEPKQVRISSKDEILKLEFFNKKSEGQVTIKKVDSNTGIALEGVEFTIYKGNEVIETLLTDANGIATSSKLTFGNYEIKETKALEGYVINNNIKDFTIDSNNLSYSFEFENTPIYGNIELLKLDRENNKKLSGAIFSVFDDENVEVGRIETNSNGFGKLENLPYGKYSVVEVKAPNGYLLNDTPQEVVISENNEVKMLIFDNKEICGEIAVVKVCKETGNKLQGAKFNIYNQNDELIETLVTDKNGLAVSELLYEGKYKVVEVEAPKGYLLDAEEQFVVISAYKESVTVVFENSAEEEQANSVIVEKPVKTGDSNKEFGLFGFSSLFAMLVMIYLSKKSS